MKKLQLEMGGKNPQVILDDADLDVAVNAALQSAFFSTGQRCTASSRIIVTAGIHDRFVNAMVEQMKALRVDDALKAGTEIGPVVDQSQLDQDLSYVDDGAEGRRQARRRRRAPEARHRGFLHGARADHRDDRRDAHQPRGSVRPGRQRHQGPATTTKRSRSPTTRRSA